MTNMAVEKALESQGVPMVRAKVGDRYVLEELQRRQWILGGEGSGHLLALDKHTTGDGLVSALQVLQACARSGKTMAALLDGLTLYPQVMVNVRLQPGQDWAKNQKLADMQRETVLRVMVEAQDAALAHRLAQGLADAARAG